MFLEVSRQVYEKLRKKLDEMGIRYEVSDCTLPNESTAKVHLEVGTLSTEQVREINAQVDAIYGAAAYEGDYDGNGIPDYMEKDGPVVVEKRERKWDQKMHTPGTEAVGWFTGKNEEEEVTYEVR